VINLYVKKKLFYDHNKINIIYQLTAHKYLLYLLLYIIFLKVILIAKIIMK